MLGVQVFSNRAACYTKLGAWQDGLKDAEQTIALKPDFAKGYSRKVSRSTTCKHLSCWAEGLQIAG